jgi:flavin reductase (DIM6/NTAB) family NADH-FMN oxidoreductase RutF
MAFMFRKVARTAAKSKHSGGWYADPYGAAARRWYDSVDGWTDRVEGAGLHPDKTGVARIDDANASFKSAD